jgi:hypothetical protein
MKAKIVFITLLVATLMMIQGSVFANDTDGSNDNSCEGGSCSISNHQSENNFNSGSDNIKDNQTE